MFHVYMLFVFVCCCSRCSEPRDQELPSNPEAANNKMVYLWRVDCHEYKSHNGWYFTLELWTKGGIYDDKGNLRPEVVGYGRSRKNEPQTFPTSIIVPPLTSKSKVETAISVESYTAFLERTAETCLSDKALLSADKDFTTV